MQPPGTTHVLKYRPRKSSSLDRSVALVLLFFVAATAVYLVRWGDLDVDLLGRVATKLVAFPSPLWPVAAIVAVACFAPWYLRQVQLVLDAEGIRMESRSPYLRWLSGRRVAWKNVLSFSYVRRTGTMVLRTTSVPWLIKPADWNQGDADPAARLFPAGDPELVVLLRRTGLVEQKSATAAFAEFDLLGDRRTRLVLGAMAVAGMYAAADRFMQHEGWAFFDLHYLWPHLVAGALAAGLAAAWLSKKTESRALETEVVLGLAVMAFVVGAPASYMAGVRINQVLGGPLQASVYHRDAACMNLVPDDAKLPVIEYTDLAKPYWCRVPPSQAVSVLVRRGLFGLYQVNLDAQTEAIRRSREGN